MEFTQEQITRIGIAKYVYWYKYYGVRVDSGVAYEEGDTCKPSRRWIAGKPTAEYLNGTSCVPIEKYGADFQGVAKIASQYPGDRIYLIAGNELLYDVDAGEYVIKGAEVIEVVA